MFSKLFLFGSFIGLLFNSTYCCEDANEEQFFRGLITLQTDDGSASQPIFAEMLKKRRMRSAFFVNSNQKRLDSPRYMDLETLQQLKKNDKWRLQYENHTKSHFRLTEICDITDQSVIDEEINHPTDFIKTNLYEKQNSFHLAAPFGAINECVREYSINSPVVKSLRGVQRGLNSRSGDIWNMKAYSVDVRRPLDIFYELVDQAVAEKKWLQLYWHLILEDCGSEIYCYTIADTEKLLDYIQSKRRSWQLFVVSQESGVKLMSKTSIWDRLGLLGQKKLKCTEETPSGRKLLQIEEGVETLENVDETVFQEELNISFDEVIEEVLETDNWCYINIPETDIYERCEFIQGELCLKSFQPLLFLDDTPCVTDLIEPGITVLKYQCAGDFTPEQLLEEPLICFG